MRYLIIYSEWDSTPCGNCLPPDIWGQDTISKEDLKKSEEEEEMLIIDMEDKTFHVEGDVWQKLIEKK